MIRTIFLLGIVIIPFLTSCQRSPWRRFLVYSNTDHPIYRGAIYKERKFDKESYQIDLKYAHPVHVSKDRILLILDELEFTYSSLLGGDTVDYVFDYEQIEILAHALSEALESISPNERIRFLVTREVSPILLSAREGTSGVIFANDSTSIHMVFDIVREDIRGNGEDFESMRFFREPTALKKAKFQLLPPEGTDLYVNPQFGNWLILPRED